MYICIYTYIYMYIYISTRVMHNIGVSIFEYFA